MTERDVVNAIEICAGIKKPKSHCSECAFAYSMSCDKDILICAYDLIKLKNARIERLEKRKTKRLDDFFIGIGIGAVIVFLAWMITIW